MGISNSIWPIQVPSNNLQRFYLRPRGNSVHFSSCNISSPPQLVLSQSLHFFICPSSRLFFFLDFSSPTTSANHILPKLSKNGLVPQNMPNLSSFSFYYALKQISSFIHLLCQELHFTTGDLIYSADLQFPMAMKDDLDHGNNQQQMQVSQPPTSLMLTHTYWTPIKKYVTDRTNRNIKKMALKPQKCYGIK